MDNNVDAEYPFTGDSTYDKLVISFYIIKGLLFAITFIFCFPQVWFELKYLIKNKKKPSHRLMTFISITLFLLCRSLQNFFGYGYHNTHTGSVYWYIGIWGTLFMAMELVYIGMYWMSILYTFFISQSIAINNVNRTWYCANLMYVFFIFWNVTLMIVANFKSENTTSSVSSKGFIIMVSILGTVIIINGVILFKYLGIQSSKSLVFRNSYERTKRLALLIFIIVMGMILREIVTTAAKISRSSNSIYITMFITFLLEFPQAIIVLFALSNIENGWKLYFKFKKVTTDNIAPELPPDSNIIESARNDHEYHIDSINTYTTSGGEITSGIITSSANDSSNTEIEMTDYLYEKDNNNNIKI